MTSGDCGPKFGNSSSYWSIGVFLFALTLARFGNWITDLCITQTMQETIAEHQRGVVHGVQHSMNQLMDMLKNTAVIILPMSETFGLLVILSMCFIVVAFGFYCYYYHLVVRTPIAVEMQTMMRDDEEKKTAVCVDDDVENIQA